MSKQLNPELGREVKLDYMSVQSQIQYLQGKVLTIVDASYFDKEQKKAVKDLINTSFSNSLAWLLKICAPDVPMITYEEAQSRGLDKEAEIGVGKNQ